MQDKKARKKGSGRPLGTKDKVPRKARLQANKPRLKRVPEQTLQAPSVAETPAPSPAGAGSLGQ